MTSINPALRISTQDDCANEPIRVPGSIQPHGFLLVLDRGTLVVVQASACVAAHLGHGAQDLLGQTLDGRLTTDADAFKRELQSFIQESGSPSHMAAALRHADGQPRPFDMLVHRIEDRIMLEFEPPTGHGVNTAAALYPSLITFVTRLQQARTIDELCTLAVDEVSRLTGFGRVVSYSFNSEGHGQVNAETLADGYDSFLGLQFPASDIPSQARELYVLNRIRLIQDAGYQPSPLVPSEIGDTGPTDLTHVALRSVSPVHLQYMRNMGTQASMSISLVVEGKLWGLISCHDIAPRRVGVPTRIACELLGKIMSLQLEAREAHADTVRRLELRDLLVRMLSSIADHDSVAHGLFHIPEVFLSFAEAAGAAIVSGDECLIFGDAPDRATIKSICSHIDELPYREVFHTDALSERFPDLAKTELACGVLAVSISELHPNYILWFRPSWVRTVEWAGEPRKRTDSESNVLSPRQSFHAWKQVVRGQSRRWESTIIDAATDLRTAVLGIVLRKAEEMADMAAELNRTNKELEAFSYSVSHDLRAPLRHIAGYAELLGEYEGEKLSEKGSRFLDNIGESARFAGSLVDSLLTFSQMGRAALRPSLADVPRIIDQVRNELAPDTQSRNITWTVNTLPPVYGDAAYLHLALRNLISNAIKYTRNREHAVIEIGSIPAEGETIFFIRDNGVGFDMKYSSKLFGVFQRLHRMEDFEGTGIGLANVRRIIERHGGRVWAEAVPDEGATFYVALPNAHAKDPASRKQIRV